MMGSLESLAMDSVKTYVDDGGVLSPKLLTLQKPMSTIMTPLRNPEKKNRIHSNVPGCTKCPPHPHSRGCYALLQEKKRNQKRGHRDWGIEDETKKGKRETKDHKRFCLGRGGEGERQRNSR